MCTCDDKCGKVLINCTCDTSKEIRKELTGKLDSGLTVQQIIQSYVKIHGETVLSAPSKRGFNLTAWIMPFAALMAGGFGVRQVIFMWTQKNSRPQGGDGGLSHEDHGQETGSSGGGLKGRLQDELDRLES